MKINKYGQVALFAVELLHSSNTNDPVDAWEKAVFHFFPKSESSRKKSCPKGAFLGLCEAGIIRDIPAGHYTHSLSNKSYALEAIKILKNNPTMSIDKNALWSKIMGSQTKVQNGQMDVVISLWNAKLIK